MLRDFSTRDIPACTLVPAKGESTWFKALGYEQNGSDQEWMYEVKAPAPDNLPALRDIFLERKETIRISCLIGFHIMSSSMWCTPFPIKAREL